MRIRFTAGLLVAALAAGMMTVGSPQARASSNGRKNFAIGLGGLAAYGLLRGKTGVGLLAAGGAAYAYKRYNDARKQEHRNQYYPTGYSGSPYYGSSSGYQYSSGYPYRSYHRCSGYQYQYQNGYAITDDGTPYARSHTGPYTTDTWGNRLYYDPLYGDGQHLYGAHTHGRHEWQ
jgi:hypothetical protein